MSLGDNVGGFAFACGYATDATREKKYVPRSLRFQRTLLLKPKTTTSYHSDVSTLHIRNIIWRKGEKKWAILPFDRTVT